MPSARSTEASSAEAQPLAAIDIGTNSFHLVVARPTGNNRFEVLDREKEAVRLGSGSGDMKRLAPDAIERGIAALSRFRRLADASGAEVHAVATSAVREAENREEFLERALAEAGVRVEVVSGVEEARLIHLGVLQAVPVYDDRVLVVDIGGGSVEFALGAPGGEFLTARSLKLGAIRMTERFFAEEPVKRRHVTEARRHIRAALTPARRMVEAHGGFDVAVGSSGTIVNVAGMLALRRGAGPLKSSSNARVGFEELTALVEDLVAAPTAADRLAAVPGLDPKRADIVLGGALVLHEACSVLEVGELVVSDHALREGVLLDVLSRRSGTTTGHLRELRYESVVHLAALAPGEVEHASRVAELACQLFEGARHRHGLAEGWEELLEAGALLCNVGLAISHERHHLHSYYVIRNSDALSGFTDHEIELIAQVARYHRKSTPKARHADFHALPAEDQAAVRVLSGILRVAVGLDRTRTGVVRGLRVVDGGADGALCVAVEADGDAELELYSARVRAGLLADVLGAPVEVELAEA